MKFRRMILPAIMVGLSAACATEQKDQAKKEEEKAAAEKQAAQQQASATAQGQASVNQPVNQLTGDDANRAAAQLIPRSGSNAQGTVAFQEVGNELRVTYDIQGLQPNTEHGFHVHDKGDCSSADAKSAGTHFAQLSPRGGTATDSPGLHAGDLPEIRSDGTGRAQGSFMVDTISIDQSYPIAGRAVIVHAGPDDVHKKSAARVACGVVVVTGVQSDQQVSSAYQIDF